MIPADITKFCVPWILHILETTIDDKIEKAFSRAYRTRLVDLARLCVTLSQAKDMEELVR